MQMDLFLACLMIGIGAMVAYVVDEQLAFTPRLAAWLDRVLGDS
jgi:hypothetical protein